MNLNEGFGILLLTFISHELIPIPSRYSAPIFLMCFIFAQRLFSLERIPYWLGRTRRRLLAEPVESSRDIHGQFALYLRSFRNDRSSSAFQYGAPDATHEAYAYTEEELLCMLMRRAYGEVVALGEPGERLPRVGARRLYAENEHWRATILELIPRAALVMVQLSEGDYTEWELQQVAASVPLENVVLLLPRRWIEITYVERVLGYFSHSPSLKAAYKAYQIELCAALHFPRGRISQEYFSVICFDHEGVAYLQTAEHWKMLSRFKDQDLLSILALKTLFRLKGFPSYTSIDRGFGCCRHPLTKDHPNSPRCILGKNCPGGRKTEKSLSDKHQPKTSRYGICCPQCLRLRDHPQFPQRSDPIEDPQ
ncbi:MULTISPECIES: hypothetical protein [unclassified Kitasatospora]|uniref:hypothetical protein n=1 Tax=unclassified Kitasatospora TaxID=2633591 RepID=UPI0033E5A3F8